MKKKPSLWRYVAPTLCALAAGLFAVVYIVLGVAGAFAGMPVVMVLLIIAVPAGMRYTSSSIVQGAAEVTAYGTAVKFK